MKKLVIAIILTTGMFLQAVPVQASDYKEVIEQNKTMNAEKDALEEKQKKLNEKLEKLTKELEENQKKLDKKQAEVEVAEQDFKNAKAEEERQQETMELRIKYLYENDLNFFEAFLNAHSMGDFLANTEYIKEMSEYDRNMLSDFEKISREKEECKKNLKKEQKNLKKTTENLYETQTNISKLIEETQINLDDVNKKLEENIKELNKLMDESGTPGPWLIDGLGYLSNPCPTARISSEFGPRTAPVPGASTYHQGRDYAAPSGNDILAAAEGVVETVAYHSVRGNYIVIKHPNGLSTWYQHCTSMFVKVGDTVSRGQKIATVGATGRVSGPHLHFIVEEPNGKLVDPRKYL